MNGKTVERGSEAAGIGHGVGALFVRRPVLAVVLNLLVVVAGLAALLGIEIRELPDIDQPVVTIRTDYKGATPETIDRQVTAIVEAAVARTPGVASISSESSSGQSRITVSFDEDTDIEVAAADLRDAVGNLRSLPTDDNFTAPTIVKADSNSDAIMRLAATAPNLPIEQLTRIVDDRIVERLAAVPGVAEVQLFGDRDPQLRIIVRPDDLAARHLTVADLNGSLGSVSLDAPAGSISDAERSMIVRANASPTTAEEVASIPLNASTRLGDVADVVVAPADKDTTLRVNGSPGVGIGIVRQAKSNTLDISNGVRAAVEELNASLPDGVMVRITSDDAVFIHDSITEVLLTLGLSTLIVVAIIYVFLRSLRVTLIPAVTVPISLIGTLAAIWAMGFSINLLSLLALVLATGLVVDDAIVVIENIARQRALGMAPWAAAVHGTRQVFFAVVSTTFTLAAVFIPISFFPGVVGRLFSEFGFVLAFSVLLSSVTALTLVPVMAARLVGSPRTGPSRNPIGRAVVDIGRGLTRLYVRILDLCLAAPAVVIAIAVLFALGAGLAYRLLPEQLTPAEDRGFIPIFISSPQGATVDYTDAQMRQIERALQPLVASGDVAAVFSFARSSGSGFVAVTLADWDERRRSQMDIAGEIARVLAQIPGIQGFPGTANSLRLRGGGRGVTFAITGNDYGALADVADRLVARLGENPIFDVVRLNYDTTQPQISINVNRERAAEVGIGVETITGVVQTLLQGRDVGNFYVGDDSFDIMAQAPTGMIQDPGALDSIQLRTSGGKMVPLSTLVTFTENAVAPTLPREDQQRALPVTATLQPGIDLRQAMNAVLTVTEAELPAGMGIVFTGEARQLNETSAGVYQTFGFAILVVLLVLAAQFESFVSALILFATVPFGIAAAIFAILLTGGSINIYSQIGLVMLVGLMAKNGILIVEFANQLRDAGQSVNDAIRNACLIRLRPVVMTMISTILGGLPLVLRSGAGSEARMALGWIIVGGLGFATLATLFLTPVVFSLLARFSSPRAAAEARLAGEMEHARIEGLDRHRETDITAPGGAE